MSRPEARSEGTWKELTRVSTLIIFGRTSTIYKLILIYYLFGHKAQGIMIKTYLKEKGNEDGKKRNGVEMEINWWCGKD